MIEEIYNICKLWVGEKIGRVEAAKIQAGDLK
jgi:hypothetical protein